MPPTLKTTSLPDALYDALRTSIVKAEVVPGSMLSESGVATQYGVARPTAKAALERLVNEGFLRREAHRAARVPKLSRGDIEDIYANRAIIEEAALGGLALTKVVPQDAQSAHTTLCELARTGGTGIADVDIAFHESLVTGWQSPRLTRMHALIMGEVELCIGQVQANLRGSEIAEQHQRILDAVEMGDEQLARQVTRDHIETSRDRLLAIYDDGQLVKEGS